MKSRSEKGAAMNPNESHDPIKIGARRMEVGQ
jgi:hypothetical protein